MNIYIYVCNQTWNWTTTLFSREIIHKCKHVWEFQFQFWLPDGQSDTRTSALNKESINLHSSSIDPFLSVDIGTGDDLWHPGWWCNNHLEKHFPIIIPLVNGKIPNHQPASSGWFKPMDGSEKNTTWIPHHQAMSKSRGINLWLQKTILKSNVAMGHSPDDFPLKTHIYRGFSIDWGSAHRLIS